MRVFFGINYIMPINKLQTTKSYWECDRFIGSESIRNVMARSRCEDIMRNPHFPDNTKDDNSDEGYKVTSIIKYFN